MCWDLCWWKCQKVGFINWCSTNYYLLASSSRLENDWKLYFTDNLLTSSVCLLLTYNINKHYCAEIRTCSLKSFLIQRCTESQCCKEFCSRYFLIYMVHFVCYLHSRLNQNASWYFDVLIPVKTIWHRSAWRVLLKIYNVTV